ncbi:MAG: serine hydrolase domain-containing protein [Verrucomicrobiota bacterium]
MSPPEKKLPISKLSRRQMLGAGMKIMGGMAAAGTFLPLLNDCSAADNKLLAALKPPQPGPDGCPQWGDAPIPVTGFINDQALSGVDGLVMRSMRECNTPGVVVAISRKGQITLSRGYGYKDPKLRVPMPHDAMLRVASVVKIIDGTAMRWMIQNGFSIPTSAGAVPLHLNTPVFPIFAARGVYPLRGNWRDPRLGRITIEHLLRHKGGLPPAPAGWTLAKELQLNRAPTGTDIVRWQMMHTLQFNPGEKSVYCNDGFTILHLLMHMAAQGKYPDGYYGFLRKEILEPAGNTDLVHSPGQPSLRDPRDVTYWSADKGRPCYPSTESEVPLCDGANDFNVDAYLPWAISAPALCSYLSYWCWDDGIKLIDENTGKLAAGVNNGFGIFNGVMPGTLSNIVQARWSLTNCAIITNRGTEHMKAKWDLPERINNRILLPYQGLAAKD